jgi:hypothetical protein
MIGEPDMSVGSPADRAHERELSFLPDCMMPDGAEPCKGYQQLQREVEQLQAKLHCMCGSPIDHSAWEGHTPVSMYDYALERAEEEARKLRRIALKAFTVVEWVVGEGRLLPEPHYDADDLLLEMGEVLGVEDSVAARAAIGENDG